jgi:hypothetical protein
MEAAISEKLRPTWHGPEHFRRLIGVGLLLAKTNNYFKR